MNGRSHIAVNAFSAFTINSVSHLIGMPYSWQQLLGSVTGAHSAIALDPLLLLHKATFYVVVIGSARLPDIDQRRGVSRLLGGHRGCTHSCLSVILLALLFLALTVSLPALLAVRGITVNPQLLEEGRVFLEAFIVGWALHLIADCLTKGGIPLFWPVTTRFGFPPIAAWRFKVGTIWEDIVLWILIFFVGFGVGTGFLGL